VQCSRAGFVLFHRSVVGLALIPDQICLGYGRSSNRQQGVEGQAFVPREFNCRYCDVSIRDIVVSLGTNSMVTGDFLSNSQIPETPSETCVLAGSIREQIVSRCAVLATQEIGGGARRIVEDT